MRFAVVGVVILCSAACGRPTDPVEIEAATHAATAGDTITMRVGDSAVLDNTVRLEFRAVENDSRCPVNVQCVWAGDATIVIDVRENGGESAEVRLHTGVEPHSVTTAGFTIGVVGLDPQPVEPDSIRQRDYSVRLAISRG